MFAIGSSIAVCMLAGVYIGVFALAVWFIHSHYVESFKK